MQGQSSEKENGLMVGLGLEQGRSGSFVISVFMLVGLLLSVSLFFVLQSFVRGVVQDEHMQASQDFVEEVVSDFNALAQPLNNLSALMALSGEFQQEKLEQYIQQEHATFSPYSQIILFTKRGGEGWSFYNLYNNSLENEIAGKRAVKPDVAMLKTLLKQGVMQTGAARLVRGIGGFEQQVRRQTPKITSKPFVMTRSVQAGSGVQGFLLAVVDAASFYDEGWITGHRMVSAMRIQDVDGNHLIFDFVRTPELGVPQNGHQVYEFSFGGWTFEVSSTFKISQRVKFLGYFPYMVGFLAVFLVIAGAFYIRYGQKQAERLAEMNEALARTNFELKAEAQERERLAEAVEEAEESSRAVVNAVGDIIFKADRDGRIVFLNRAWEKMTGFEVSQSTGRSLEQLIYPQDRNEIMQGFKAVLYDSRAEARCFTQVRVSDGTFKAVELVMQAVGRGESSHGFIVGTFTDIEERRKVERALSDAEKKYRSIVENAVGGIFQMTADGLFLSANPAMAKILGYGSSEHLLREVKNANEQIYVDGGGRAGFYERLVGLSDAVSQEVQIRQRDGTVIWVHESVRAVSDDAGQLLFIEGSLEDITQRKTSELAIQEAKVHSDLANRAKSEFLSNMSHELRTPLNSIIGFSEMIKNEVFGRIEQRSYHEYACDIHESGRKLLQVINEILDISKIEAGDRQLNESVVKVRDVFDGVVELLETKIDNAHLHITKALDDVPDIVAEELAIKQILLNLLSNAVKFTPDHGRITVSGHVSREGDVHISITDTGIGLDEYEIKKALSPFGQVNNELSRSGSGTGLGLTLVDALVKLHGGAFELFSKKGIGTTATIILPAERVVKKTKASKTVDVYPENGNAE
ncbi:MAG: PAS domain-containing sensor histidine kinase [Rhodospirillales bacterium]|nr:PAS domain-containing sensor histidine kinase [Rhodospirillales bacterium]